MLWSWDEFPEVLDVLPYGVIVVDQCGSVRFTNRFAEDTFRMEENQNELLLKLNEEPTHNSASFFPILIANRRFLVQKFQLYQQNHADGLLYIFQDTDSMEGITNKIDSYRELSLDLQAIFDSSYDVIYVSDGNGVTLRVSKACEILWGYKENELVGKSVYELERQGVFKPSVTRLVLERGEKVSDIQTTRTGRRLMVVSTPIKDKEGRIVRVVNASRDITEVSRLQTEVETLKRLTEGYRQEIIDLRSKHELEKKIVFRSKKMENVFLTAQKIANVDSTVLLMGGSGIGKEMLASYIHSWSNRKDRPFITLNCGSLPQPLLETELFGSRTNSTEGTLSLLEKADGGTLFLDEIEKMPMTLQIKLLHLMQNKHFIKSESNQLVPVNIRFIAATQHDLEEEVKQNRFRKDLFYLLNVVPIVIPLLKERKEDIIPLILHFIRLINKRYNLQKKFTPKLLKRLQEYSWPGNVRELQNIVERLLVTIDGLWIDVEHLPESMRFDRENGKSVEVNRIIPLKNAVELVEKELLEMAMEQYHSTTKIAEVLGVNQSTISRKLQRLRNENEYA